VNLTGCFAPGTKEGTLLPDACPYAIGGTAVTLTDVQALRFLVARGFYDEGKRTLVGVWQRQEMKKYK